MRSVWCNEIHKLKYWSETWLQARLLNCTVHTFSKLTIILDYFEYYYFRTRCYHLLSSIYYFILVTKGAFLYSKWDCDQSRTVWVTQTRFGELFHYSKQTWMTKDLVWVIVRNTYTKPIAPKWKYDQVIFKFKPVPHKHVMVKQNKLSFGIRKCILILHLL